MTEGNLIQELTLRLKNTEFFKPSYNYYTLKISFLFLALCFDMALLLQSSSTAFRMVAILIWALLSGQFGMIGHDAGHNCTSKYNKLNKFYGYLSMSFVNGNSFFAWLFQHKSHHRYTNIILADVDIHSNFLIAFYPERHENMSGVTRKLRKYQHLYFWLIISIYMFYKRVTSIYITLRYIRRAKLDILFITLHYLVMLVFPAFVLDLATAILYYTVYSLILSVYYSLIFSVNHLGLKPAKQSTKIIETLNHRLNHTRTINNPAWLDFLFGGLNFHIEHHLFPYAATNRYRMGSHVIKEFCREKKLPYHNSGFIAALGDVYCHLRWASNGGENCGEENSI